MSFYPYLLLIKCLLAQLIYRHTLTDTSLYHICAFTTECSPIHVVLRNDSMTLAYVLRKRLFLPVVESLWNRAIYPFMLRPLLG
jgi:hypothetical protein